MESLYEYWKSHPHLWFNSTYEDDIIITKLFYDLLYINHNILSYNNPISVTSYIILYDQIVKHINRIMGGLKEIPLNFLDYCYNSYNIYKDQLDDFEFMFILMPIRHTHNIVHVKYVLNETWMRLEKNINDDNTSKQLRSYLTATYERYIKCTPNMDKENLTLYEPYKSLNPFSQDKKYDSYILDEKCTFKNELFMSKLYESYFLSEKNKMLFDNMKDFLTKHNMNDKIITVSISGGVDSMICSYILYHLKQPFIAVHIDYYNREECMKEEELLIWWCNTLNVPLYIRRIDEINRPTCMKYELRELYESYTKNIRFNSYINSNELNDIYDINEINDINEILVMLGHNKDDTIENTLTNIASNSHYDNLLGMEPVSKQLYNNKEITIIRPLLNVYKKDIYDFAIENHIPFLVDSTPKWSQRGKIRDIVRPALEEWNPLILEGMILLSDKMSQMTQLLNQLVCIDNKYNSIHDVPINETYWTILLKKYNIYITQKTLSCLITKIKFLQLNEYKLKEPQKLTLSKNHFIIFKQGNSLLCIDIN
jgi:tRNA(Ile)-lysidine synthetase-like protein